MRSVWSWCQGWPLLLSFGTSIRSPASVEAVPVPAGTRLEQDASDDGSGAALAQRLGSSGVLPRHNIEGDKGRPGGQRLVEPCKADNTAIMIVHILIGVVLDAMPGAMQISVRRNVTKTLHYRNGYRNSMKRMSSNSFLSKARCNYGVGVARGSRELRAPQARRLTN